MAAVAPFPPFEQAAAPVPKGHLLQLIPRKLECLFRPKRYKIAHGGRGSAKSWSFARALLIMGSKRKLRVICFREIQASIGESVHALIKQQVELMGLSSMWDVQAEKIVCKATGSEFNFSGLSNLTSRKIKSYEGYDVAWVEEAETVIKESWQKLIPTIRKPDSFGPGHDAEIWISFNPQLDTDYTYIEFVEGRKQEGEDYYCVAMNYTDNPWFPDVLEKERIKAKAKMSVDEYNNIWKGMTRAAVQGAIFATEVAELRAQGRYGMVPWNPKLKVHVVMDLGWNDAMFVAFVQKNLNALCVIEAFEVDHTTLDDLNADIRQGRRYRWGSMFLPHDGSHGDYKTGRSAIQIMRHDHGWDAKQVPNIPKEGGIKAARGMLAMTYIDKHRATPLMTALRNYKREINKHGEGTGAAHDAASHGGDCYRYIALCASRMSNSDAPPPGSHNRGAVSYPVDEEMGM